MKKVEATVVVKVKTRTPEAHHHPLRFFLSYSSIFRLCTIPTQTQLNVYIYNSIDTTPQPLNTDSLRIHHHLTTKNSQASQS